MTVATVAALVWANWPGTRSYFSTWLSVAPWSSPVGLHLTVRDWVNEALMLAFFALIGLEIRREFTAGELRSARRALVPVVAALVGMAVPAVIYTAVVAGGVGARGWGIPMATDVAFALGALALIGGTTLRVRVFLMTLAVADDIASIVVLVVFYSHDTRLAWLAGALGALGALTVVWIARVRAGWLRVVLGAAAWWAMLHAGVEAAVIGVALGAFLPARRPARSELRATPAGSAARATSAGSAVRATSAGSAVRAKPSAASPTVRAWVHRLEPVVNMAVLPVFALANTGLSFAGSGLGSGASLRVFAAVVAARLIGKPLGITVATLVTMHVNPDVYQPPIVTRSLVGVGAVASIGFTVPLLIIQTALPVGPLATAATAGLLAGSVLGAGAGLIVLRGGAS